MTGHRRHQQDFAGLFLAADNVEMDQVTEGTFDYSLNVDKVILAVFVGECPNPPIRFGDHPFERAFGHFTPSGHPLHAGVRKHCPGGIRRHSARCRAKPLICIAKRFHEIVGHHVAHRGVSLSLTRQPGQFVALPPTAGDCILHGSMNRGESWP